MSDINKKEIHLKAFSELKGKIFHIPYQQRGYKWTKSNVEELLNDLREFISCNKESKRVVWHVSVLRYRLLTLMDILRNCL